MLGASHAVLLGAATAAAPTYDALVASFDPNVVSYWKFENDGTDEKGTADAIITGSPELGVDTIVDLDTIADGAPADGECIAWPGTRGVYAEAAHNSAHKSAQGTIVVTFQHDVLSVKSTLVAADRPVGGISSGPGGLSMEVQTDGVPRCFLRSQSGGAIVELVGQAGDIQPNQAYTLIFKWGTGGLSMALWNASGNPIRRVTDPLEDGATGTSQIRFGAWHTDVSHHNGPYGRVVWLNRRISDLDEAALTRARTLTHAPPPAEPAALTRPLLTLAVGQDAVPGSNVVYVAPGGSGNGTIGSPYGTLEAAHNHSGLGAGWTIVLRGGNHVRSGAFTPTKSGTSGSKITVMAFPGETVLLDYSNEFAAFRTPGSNWTSLGGGLWQSNSSGFGSPARIYGHWEEAGEWWQLYGYKTTGQSITGTGSSYYGPGCLIHTDGRIRIRFSRPHASHVTSKWPSYQPGTSGGNWIVPGTENPNDYSIHITRQNAAYAFVFSNVSDWTFKDINVCGRERINRTQNTVTRIIFERGLWRGPRYGVRKEGPTTANGFEIRKIKAAHGRLDYFSWLFMKGLAGGATEMDDDHFINNRPSGGGGGSGMYITDCYIANFFDVGTGVQPTADTKFLYNWFDNIIDDMFQMGTNSNGVEFGYNVVMNSPLNDADLSGGSSTGNFFIHHNFCWQRLPRLWFTNVGLACKSIGVTHFDSGATGRFQPRQIYNNTLIQNGGSDHEGLTIGHCDSASSNELSLAHSVFNNLLMIYCDRNDYTTQDSTGGRDMVSSRVYLDGFSNEEYDNNHYMRVLAYATPRSPMIGPYYDREDNGTVRSGGPYTFASAAALAASGANKINAEVNGTSQNILNTGVGGMNAAAPFIDLEGLDLRPKAGSALLTGGKNLTGRGWPGGANVAWRGAIDPNGSGNEIGPRS